MFSLNQFSIEEILFILQENLVRNLEESLRKDSGFLIKSQGEKWLLAGLLRILGPSLKRAEALVASKNYLLIKDKSFDFKNFL